MEGENRTESRGLAVDGAFGLVMLPSRLVIKFILGLGH